MTRQTNSGPRVALISGQAFSLYNLRGPLMRHLADRGATVFGLAPDFEDETREKVRAFGAEPVDFQLRRAGLNPIADLGDIVGLKGILRKLELDVTLGYFIKPVIYGTLAAVWAGVPRRTALVPGLGFVFSTQPEGQTVRRRLLRAAVGRMYGAAFGRCDRVIFQNEDDPAWFVDRGLLDPGKIVQTTGTGIDLAWWSPAPFPEGPVTFLQIARLVRDKGVADFAAAARIVKRTRPEVRFVLVGGLDPNPAGVSREEVDSWVAAGVIEWAGEQRNPRSFIEESHVFVLPSYYREGVPHSTQEALGTGRPVITTDNVGCRETVIHGENGFMVPVRDPQALASAMLRFVDNPSLIAVMGARSRRLAAERFNVDHINRKIGDAVLGVSRVEGSL